MVDLLVILSLTHVLRDRRVVCDLSCCITYAYPVVMQKCDGVKPRCSRCEEKGRVCIYREEKSGQELQREVASLESRIREAELRRQTSPTLHNPLNRNSLPPGWWKTDEPPTVMRPHL